MHLVRDLLDKQLVDCENRRIGKVDGVVLQLREDRPPRLAAIETGSGVLLRRFGLRSSRKGHRIPYSKVRDVGVDVTVEAERNEMPLEQWQNWLRYHVLKWIPGGAS